MTIDNKDTIAAFALYMKAAWHTPELENCHIWAMRILEGFRRREEKMKKILEDDVRAPFEE